MADDAPKPTEDTAAVAGDEAGDDAKGKENGRRGGRDRRDQTPIEELYDLTKPIPKVDRPNKDEHEAELAEITKAFDELVEKRREIQQRIDAAMEQNESSSGLNAIRDELKALNKQKSDLIKSKQEIRLQLDQVKSQADKLISSQKNDKTKMKFNSLQEIDAEIAKLQRKQETTSMSLNEEKKLIKDMDALKASKALVAEYKHKEADLEDVKEKRKTVSGLLSAKDKEIDAVQVSIDAKASVMKEINEKEKDKRSAVDGLFKEREEYKKLITAKLKEKDACRAAYREKNNAWFNYKRAINAKKQMEYEEEKRKREEERQAWLAAKEAEEAKKIPYEEEQGLCDYLADYLTRTYLGGDAAASPSNKEQEANKKDPVVPVKDNPLANDDPFAGFKPVKKNEEEIYFGKGKGKKKRVRAKKQQDIRAGPFTLNVDTFEQFGLLNLTPPTSVDQVEKSVKELREKKEWYSKQPRGSVPTAAEIRKANEKAAAKLRQEAAPPSSTAASAAPSAASTKSDPKNFSLSNDDFAPLGSGGTAASINSSWGAAAAKPAEEQQAPAEGVDAVAENAVP